jgi:predicted nucleic acid-binding protein
MKRSRRIFLDTSVIFAAVLSETGGARVLFRLGEARVLQLIVGSNILRECEQVIRRKAPASLPTLAYLLELGLVEIATASPEKFIEQAKAIVAHEPDVYVLAEAMAAEPDWFITHDKVHFLKAEPSFSLTIRIGTPGDLIQALEDEFTSTLETDL